VWAATNSVGITAIIHLGLVPHFSLAQAFTPGEAEEQIPPSFFFFAPEGGEKEKRGALRVPFVPRRKRLG
jgi:hypothetical protein